MNTTSRKWKSLPFFEDRKKVPLIVLGDGMFEKSSARMRRVRSGVVGRLWSVLKRRERAGDLLVVCIDEFKTSKICSKCVTQSLSGKSSVKGNAVLVCSECGTLWQRDVNACRNMMRISLSIWEGIGRPQAYQRQ